MYVYIIHDNKDRVFLFHFSCKYIFISDVEEKATQMIFSNETFHRLNRTIFITNAWEIIHCLQNTPVTLQKNLH